MGGSYSSPLTHHLLTPRYTRSNSTHDEDRRSAPDGATPFRAATIARSFFSLRHVPAQSHPPRGSITHESRWQILAATFAPLRYSRFDSSSRAWHAQLRHQLRLGTTLTCL